MTEYVKTRRRKTYARKYRDLLADCPLDYKKHPQIFGEMVLEALCVQHLWRNHLKATFPDDSMLDIDFNDDKTLRKQFLDESLVPKGWEQVRK